MNLRTEIRRFRTALADGLEQLADDRRTVASIEYDRCRAWGLDHDEATEVVKADWSYDFNLATLRLQQALADLARP